MRIRTRILGGYLACLAIVIVIGGALFAVTLEFRAKIQSIYDDKVERVIALSDLQRQISALHRQQHEALDAGSQPGSPERDQLDKIEMSARAALHAFEAGLEGAHDGATYRRLIDRLEALLAHHRVIMTLAAHPESRSRAIEISQRHFLDSFREAEAAIAAVAGHKIEAARNEFDASIDFTRDAALASAALGLLSVAGIILLGLALSRAIAGPLAEITDGLERLASGDREVRVPAIDRTDEIGGLARAFQMFLVHRDRFDDLAAKLKQRSAALEATLETMNEGISVFDTKLCLAVWNDHFFETLGFPRSLAKRGTRLADFVAIAAQGEEPRPGTLAGCLAEAATAVALHAESRLPNGRVIEISSHAMPEGGFVATYTDISSRKQVEARAQHIARHDALTGLANREHFVELLNGNLAAPEAAENRVAVVLLDVDNFKDVNNTLGHDAGDLLLQAVADRLASAVGGAGNVAARLGGDEFAAMLCGFPDREAAMGAARSLLDLLRAPMLIEDHELPGGCTLGLAVYPDDAADPANLMINADLALNRAKAMGRSLVAGFEPAMRELVERRRALSQKLKVAVEEHQFMLYFQPQLDLGSGKVVGVEALLRWRHPVDGMISPAEFVPIAEGSGLIVPIGEWVLEESCRRATAWKKAGLPALRMGVNISAVQFRRRDLPEQVWRLLHDTGAQPTELLLEITESAAMEDAAGALAVLRSLAGMGVQLALDDFGTGYSSLAYLGRFPFGKVKIDKSFVDGIGKSHDAEVIVRTVIGMGHALGMRVVAEGVETLDQARYLREQDCDEIQGYLLGRPMAADDLMAWYRRCDGRFDLDPPEATSAAGASL